MDLAEIQAKNEEFGKRLIALENFLGTTLPNTRELLDDLTTKTAELIEREMKVQEKTEELAEVERLKTEMKEIQIRLQTMKDAQDPQATTIEPYFSALHTVYFISPFAVHDCFLDRVAKRVTMQGYFGSNKDLLCRVDVPKGLLLSLKRPKFEL